MLNNDMSNVLDFQQCLFFAHGSSHRCNSGTQISVVTWRTVHEHIVVDVYSSRTLIFVPLLHCGCCYVQTASAVEC